MFKAPGGFLIGFAITGLLISLVAVQQIKAEINFTLYVTVVVIVVALGAFLLVYSGMPSREAQKPYLILKDDFFVIYCRKEYIELSYEKPEKIKYAMQDPSRVSKYRYTHGDLRIRTKDGRYFVVACADAQSAKLSFDKIFADKGIVIDSRID